MSPLARVAGRWLAEGRPAMLVRVLRARGSVPRDPGACMLVSAEATAGTIGGGHLEWRAMALARERLGEGVGAAEEFAFALGPSLGQCCGGTLALRIEPLTPQAMAAGTDQAPRFELQLYGAGHVARAVVRLLETIACRVRWFDAREAAWASAPPFSAPHIERLAIEPGGPEVRAASPQAAHLVMTHSHDLDFSLVEAVLRRGEFGFLGLIGSATKRARFEHRLRSRGIGQDAIARLTCPVGVEGIVGKEPEVIAVAVAAQLLRLQPEPPKSGAVQACASCDSACGSITHTV